MDETKGHPFLLNILYLNISSFYLNISFYLIITSRLLKLVAQGKVFPDLFLFSHLASFRNCRNWIVAPGYINSLPLYLF